MSKLQFCSESNYAAIFHLNSLPGKILFLSFRLGFFFWKLGKKEDVLDWEWGLYSATCDREKRPWQITCSCNLKLICSNLAIIFFNQDVKT